MKKLFILSFVFSLFFLLSFNSHGQNPKKIYKTGITFFESGKYDDAIKTFSKAIELKPNFDKAYYGRAEAYEKLDKLNEAFEDYKRITVISTKDADAFYNAGRLAYKLNNYKESYGFLEVATSLDRRLLKAYQLKVVTLGKLGNYDKALHECETAYTLNRKSAINFYNFAFIYDSLNNYTEAERNYQDAIDRNDKFEEAYIGYSKLLLKQGRLDDALLIINKEIRLNTKATEAYLVRAIIRKEKMDYPNAINDLSKVSILSPGNQDVFFQRGKYYQEFNQHQNAINDFTKVISMDESNYLAYLSRAKSYEETNNYKLAIKDYQKLKTIPAVANQAAELLVQAEKRLFDLNKETNIPQIVLTSHKIDNDNSIEVNRNLDMIEFSGKIIDESKIEYIKINGNAVDFNTDNENNIFKTKIDIKDKTTLIVEAADVYKNINKLKITLKQTEGDAPEIKLISPYASDNHEIFLDTNEPNLYVEGTLTDESYIKRVFINGLVASFNPNQFNPKFSATINVANKNAITVKAEDVYGNIAEVDFNLNRATADLLADNPMGRTWVVFIENSNYQTFASLEGPGKDVTLMKSALANYKINNIIHKRDMSKSEMERFFSIELRDLVRSNHVNSITVWYAGHGKFINETGYWIPIDAKRDDEFTYFSINSLKASLQGYSKYITHTLVITDACESGPTFYQAMRSTSVERNCNDVNATKFKSSQVFSSAGYELAVDNSQFTKTFANTLTYNKDACIPIEKIVTKVTNAVSQNNTQRPKFGKIQGMEDEDGTFFFMKKD